MNITLFALILFAVTYILLIAFQKYRPYIALASAAVFTIIGSTGLFPEFSYTVSDALSNIDWNVLLMIIGMMGTVYLFTETGMADKMSNVLVSKAGTVGWSVIILSLFAGVISAFLDNVATVLMVAPVGLAISKKLKINPIPVIISIAVSSNLQGAATLVGDTTSIMLGGYAGMNFVDFIWMQGRPGIFWAVELGALATVPVIMIIFRKDKGAVTKGPVTKVTDYVPTVLLLGTILCLILASFFEFGITLFGMDLTNGVICVGFFALGLIYTLIRKRKDLFKSLWGEIDYETLLLLASLFVVIGTLTEQGIIEDIAALIVRLGGSNLFLMYTIIVWASVVFSAFIDNIPYVATMLPVVQGIAGILGVSPLVLYFGLLVGATLGGNITPVGASANITAIGILRRNGYEVKNKDFFRIGLPFTLVAVLVGYLFCWFVWAH